MTLTASAPHVLPSPTRALQPDAGALQPVLLIEGARRGGMTPALVAAAAAARDAGYDVIEIRVTHGDPTVTTDSVLALLPAARAGDAARPVPVDGIDRPASIVERDIVHAGFLGDFATVDQLLDGLVGPAGPAVEATIAWARAVRCGEIREGRGDTIRALDRSVEAPGEPVDLPVAVLQLMCFLQGDAKWWDETIASCAALDLDPVLRLVEECLEPRPAADRTGLLRAVRASMSAGEPWKVVALHVAWSLLDALDPRRGEIETLLEARHEQHDLLGYLALCRRTVAAFQAGRLEVAAGGFAQARERAEALGAQTFVALIDSFQALVHAVRGEHDQAAAKAEQAAGWALRNGAPLVAQSVDQARSSLDLALGRFEEAYARTSGERPAGEHWIERGYGPIGLLDAVESAARLRLPAHGHSLIQAAEGALGTHRTPRQSMVLLAARAIVDEHGATQDLFEASLRSLQLEDAPFEVARVRLAYGEWLRRSMQALNARVQFRLAESAFAALGATDWQARARRELRAAGGVAESGTPGTANPVELSEQELRVASMAASGLSNKQIASRLYLSPRTVSGHLYRVFPKLGITSRAALRDALEALGRSRGTMTGAA